MRNELTKDEINTLLDALTEGQIDDVGLMASRDSLAMNMKQKDIDSLVSLIIEVQQYREIGTVEECRKYKEKALS